MRMHGHRAAKIDPLDLIHREEVAALSPERYGLVDDDRSYNVNGILWTKRVGESGEGEGEEWWTLKRIRDHLWSVYVGNIAYEVRCFHLESELVFTCFLFKKKVYAFPIENGTSLVFPSSRISNPSIPRRHTPFICGPRAETAYTWTSSP